jgi:hypothetical protein
MSDHLTNSNLYILQQLDIATGIAGAFYNLNDIVNHINGLNLN